MATVTGALNKPAEVFYTFPITDVKRLPNGDVEVYGPVTDGSVDADHQRVNPTWSGKALQDWYDSGANIRVQHSPFLYPAGKGTALEVGKVDTREGKQHWIKALVAAETPAAGLVMKKVLRDFSIGILDPVLTYGDPTAPGGEICGGRIGEVSLVDRGSNKNTTFTIVKSVGDGIELVAAMTSMSPMARMALTKRKLKSGRNVDSGGKDRSHVPADRFAGPEGTFPVENRGDVSDAASLAHHADNPGAVRSKIRHIATEDLGMETSELPPSLKADGAQADDGEGSGAFPGAAPPFKKGKGKKKIGKGDAAEDYPGDKGEEDETVADYNSDSPEDDDGPDDKKKAEKAMRKALRRVQRRALKSDAERGNNGGRDPAAAGKAKAKDMVPAGKHREPDGAQAEGIEHDAGMHSSDEGGDETGVPGNDWGVRKAAPSYGMQRLHDALCPAYQWRDVRKAYGLSRDVGAVVPVRELESAAMEAIEKGRLGEAEYLTGMLQVAAQISHLGPAELLDARKALPAMFPDTHPAQHSDVRPSMFQRGYQSAGRPALSAAGASGGFQPPKAGVREVSAQDFQREYLQAGHAAAPLSEGTQAGHSTAAFGQALTTMQRMHERVTQLWPDMCPIKVAQHDYTTGEGQTGIRPGRAPSLPAAPGEGGITKQTEVMLRKKLAKRDSTITALRDEIAILGAMPDPEHAPFRGLPQLDGPVDRDSYIDKALGSGGPEPADAEFLAYMQSLASSGDPSVRVAAGKAIETILTK